MEPMYFILLLNAFFYITESDVIFPHLTSVSLYGILNFTHDKLYVNQFEIVNWGVIKAEYPSSIPFYREDNLDYHTYNPWVDSSLLDVNNEFLTLYYIREDFKNAVVLFTYQETQFTLPETIRSNFIDIRDKTDVFHMYLPEFCDLHEIIFRDRVVAKFTDTVIMKITKKSDTEIRLMRVYDMMDSKSYKELIYTPGTQVVTKIGITNIIMNDSRVIFENYCIADLRVIYNIIYESKSYWRSPPKFIIEVILNFQLWSGK